MVEKKSVAVKQSSNIVSIMAGKYNLDPEKFKQTVKATVMRPGKDGRIATDEEFTAFLIVANKYNLDPFTNEIYAFPSKKGGIIPVIGVDGFVRKICNHEDFDGMEISLSEEIITPEGGKPCPEWCEVKLYRKGVERPIIIREYLDEVYRPAYEGKDGYKSIGPWQTHTKRLLRHKTIIQAGRAAGFMVGVFDEDEAQRIIESETFEQPKLKPPVDIPQAKKPEPEKPPEAETAKEVLEATEIPPQSNSLSVLEALQQPVGAKFDCWGVLFDFKVRQVGADKRDITDYRISPRESTEIMLISKWGGLHEGVSNGDTIGFTDVLVTVYNTKKQYKASTVALIEKGLASE